MPENITTPKTCEPPSSRSVSAPGSPKIYRVEISYEIYVYADHERDAVDYAHDGVRDEEPEMECATLVKSVDEVPKQWRDSIPYGARDLIKDDKSIRQILSENVKTVATEGSGESPTEAAQHPSQD
jgi:hypothetical protein